MVARDAFQNMDFATAVSRLRTLIGTGRAVDPRVMALARRIYAASLYGLGGQRHEDEAHDAIRDLLREDPAAEIDGNQFEGGFVRLFNRTRRDMAGELEQIRTQRIHESEIRRAAETRRHDLAMSLLTTATRIEHVPRGLMFIPFGVGQFANRQPFLGGVFLGAEALFLGASIATYAIVDQLRPASNVIYGSLTSSAPADQFATIQRWEILNYVSVGLLGVTAIAGVIQALVAYVPDTVVSVPRSLPPEINTLRISVGAGSAGLFVTF